MKLRKCLVTFFISYFCFDDSPAITNRYSFYLLMIESEKLITLPRVGRPGKDDFKYSLVVQY